MSMRASRFWLLGIWLVLGALLFVSLFVQYSAGVYAYQENGINQGGKSLEWFTSLVWPTLALIIGVSVVDLFGQSTEQEQRRVNVAFFGLTVFVSLLYLMLIGWVMYMAGTQQVPGPITPPPLGRLEQSTPWLVFMQGIATAFVGAFFAKGQSDV